jgi:hypothetical protein
VRALPAAAGRGSELRRPARDILPCRAPSALGGRAGIAYAVMPPAQPRRGHQSGACPGTGRCGSAKGQSDPPVLAEKCHPGGHWPVSANSPLSAPSRKGAMTMFACIGRKPSSIGLRRGKSQSGAGITDGGSLAAFTGWGRIGLRRFESCQGGDMVCARGPRGGMCRHNP